MEKTKKLRERGLREYRIWRQGNLRGHDMIGRWIVYRYGLLEEDLNILEKEQRVHWSRGQRKRVKLGKEIKRGIK